MDNAYSINFALNPVMDIAKFNSIMATMKTGLTSMNPIDAEAVKKSLIFFV